MSLFYKRPPLRSTKVGTEKVVVRRRGNKTLQHGQQGEAKPELES